MYQRETNSEAVVELLDAVSVADLCSCSVRTVRRLSDAGRMPRPVRLGQLVRWRRAELEAWIAAGCPAVRTPKVASP
jgi:excisionase family DNA binding protein